MSWLYRAGQFWQAIRAKPLSDAALAEIAAILTAAELELFQQFNLGEQWHSYRVMSMLREANQTEPDLLTAALLHDVGKTKSPLTVWDRSLIVVVEKLRPHKVIVWGEVEGAGWKRPFWVKAQHPAWGAEMAATVGSRPRTVNLIRRHQDPLPPQPWNEEDELLAQLQWADNQN